MTKSLKATIREILAMIFFFLFGGGGFLIVLYALGGTTNLPVTFTVWGVTILIWAAYKVGYYKGVKRYEEDYTTLHPPSWRD